MVPWRFPVTDTGIGIAPEDQARIVEDFRQVGGDYAHKKEGTGLGLTLVEKFVELHGGRICHRRTYMKKIVGFIGLAFLHLMVACSSMETRQWQPTAVTDFKSVAGKWEGLLTLDDPRALHYDRATLIIDDTGVCEATVTRTRTTAQGGSVSYGVIHVFAEQGKLVLTNGKLSTKFEKGGQTTVQLYVDPASGERMLKADGKNSEGFTYSADLKRTGDSASAK